MLSFKTYILLTEGLTNPISMKKTFDDYFKHTKGMVSFDKKNKEKLNFSTTKSVATEIIASIDSILGYNKNKLFQTSPITKDYESDNWFHFSITFKKDKL